MRQTWKLEPSKVGFLVIGSKFLVLNTEFDGWLAQIFILYQNHVQIL